MLAWDAAIQAPDRVAAETRTPSTTFVLHTPSIGSIR